MKKYTYEEMLKDFKIYLELKWAWLGLPRPTDLQFEMADHLQLGGDRILLKGFRGIAKSWTTASYAEFRWLRDRDLRVLITSGNQRKADEISLFIRNCIDGFPPLEPLRWADWEKQNVRWGIQQFNIRGAPPDIAPSCKAASIGSMLVGSRAHLIIADDIETPSNSDTVEGREKLLAQLGEFESILLPGGDIAILGTPQSEESIYNEIERRGYNITVWPVRIPTPAEVDLYRGRLSPSIKQRFASGDYGQPAEPTRFPEEVLLQKEAGMSSSAWRLQMMLDTTLADRDKHPLKLNDLIVMPLDNIRAPMTIVWSANEKHRITDIPQMGFSGDYLVGPMFVGEQWLDYERKYLFIDPSGRGDNETTWCIIGTMAGRYFLLDFGGSTDGYGPETLAMLLLKAKDYSVHSVVYEDNFGDGMFGEILKSFFKDRYACEIIGRKSSGRKELRMIDTIEPVLRQHKLVVDHSALLRDSSREDRQKSLQYQLTRVTRSRRCLTMDDALDVLSIGIGHLMDTAGISNEESLRKLKQEQLELALEDILKASKMFSLGKSREAFNRETTKFLKGQRRLWNRY